MSIPEPAAREPGLLSERLERLAREIHDALTWADEARRGVASGGNCSFCNGAGCHSCDRGRVWRDPVDGEREAKVFQQLGPEFEGYQKQLRDLTTDDLPAAAREAAEKAQGLLARASHSIARSDFQGLDRSAGDAMGSILDARNAVEAQEMQRPKAREERVADMTQRPDEFTIPVTQVKMTLLEVPGPTKAIASVTLGGSFIVHGVRVVDGPTGLFMGLPQRKDGDQYRDLAHPLTGELRARMTSAVLEEYQKLREREGPERSR